MSYIMAKRTINMEAYNISTKIRKLKEPSETEEIICMDMLNYSNSFFNIPHRDHPSFVDFEEDLEEAKKKVKDFIDASERSGYKIIGFIDKAISTEETFGKWKMRRMNELICGRKNIMANMSLFLGSIFQSFGVTVHFSTVDCDDTIAAFALHLKGNVLSRDCDFFRYYTQSSRDPFCIFSNFHIDTQGKLILTKHNGPSLYRENPSKREISPDLPQTEKNTFFLDQVPSFMRQGKKWLEVNQMYQRGCGSNLTQMTNPHISARSLRQGLYQRMGYGAVMEVIANWNERQGEPEFQEDLIQPSSALDQCLDNPRRAFMAVFENTRRSENISIDEWKNHVFSQKSVIAELCAWATGTHILENMEIWLQK
eukprot:GFUD01075580.1.p1 GENE.GFUD01075580.1~~GFUD01075580.1.p1  ORF type:complete len:368 (+),score=78.46 GFUD01075580.1:58-1161(+)